MKALMNTFTEIIAARRFDVKGEKGVSELEVQVGRPIQDVSTVNGSDWRCPVRVIVNGNENIKSAYGIDSVQALQLALEYMVNIQALHYIGKNGRVIFCDQEIESKHKNID